MTPIKVINCKNCGGALPYFVESRKLATITCAYCGSVHDIKEEFKLLDQFVNRFGVTSPIKLGMSGKINDIEFTVIGEVIYSDKVHKNTKFLPFDAYWIEYQLYSKTHGFATLSFEKGHFTFSRRVRDVPSQPGNLYNGYPIVYKEHTFKVFDTYKSVINEVTGELTWHAKAGDTSRVTDAIDPPFLLSIEKNKNETEYYLSQYIEPQIIYKNFAVDKSKRVSPQGIIAAQPFYAPMLKALSKAAFPTAIFSIIALFILLIGFRGDTVYFGSFTAPQVKKGITIKDINITNTKNLISLKFETTLSNNWTSLDITFLKDGKERVSFDKEISYYFGGSGDDSWREGSRTAKIYFRLPEPGSYTLSIKSAKNQAAAFSLWIKEGILTMRYFLYLFMATVLSSLWYYFQKYNFEAKKRDEEHSTADAYWILFIFLAIVFIATL